MTTTAPYGEWVSPISAADLAGSQHPVSGACFVGDDVWWAELRSDEGGRYSVRRDGPAGEPVDVLPAPWNARSRVHEYGGGAWTVGDDAVLVFVEFGDQRIYRLDPGASTPLPLTPIPEQPAGWRYGELSRSADGSSVWCVREAHSSDGTVSRDIVAVPLDGSAGEDPSAVVSVTGGSNFLAYPRVSPDGRQLAWIAWDHPQMPWDGTELRVADLELDDAGRPHAGAYHTLLGSHTESVLQPEWHDDDRLYVIADRTGWWNLYEIDAAGGEPRPLCPRTDDFAGPLWNLAARWYAVLPDGRLLTARTHGLDTLALLDPGTGALVDLELGDLTSVNLGQVRDGQVLLTCGGARTPAGARLLDRGTGAVRDIRLSVDDLPPLGYLPAARAMTFTGVDGRDVHTVVYPPTNPDFEAPADELPPYIAFVHGGPTAHVAPAVQLTAAYFTSRGLGVVDVNYGGSTGYGREYRERLKGQWGIVDVEDTVAAVLGLADAGLADRDRLTIEGGSAGGWTVLAALTTSSVFACGVSYYGVAELMQFVAETHDFESRYIDGLIGPLPEARALYTQRAPLNNVDGLSCPVLLLQGLDDPIVPPSQAERFRDALVAKGIPHAYRSYAGESHGFRRTATIIDAREAELSFYGQVFGFEPAGVARLELWRP